MYIQLVELLLHVTCASCGSLATSVQLHGDQKPESDGQVCPTWFLPEETHSGTGTVCKCGSLPGHAVKCDPASNETWLYEWYCSTYDNATGMTLLSSCPFNRIPGSSSGEYILLPKNLFELNEFMCGDLNRTGRLCSQCKKGLGPAVLSRELKCLKCLNSSYSWLVYILVALLPTTVFFVLVIFCQFRASSGAFNGFIFLCHYATFTIVSHPQVYKDSWNIPQLSVITFYDIWSLDFFRFFTPNFCVNEELTMLHVLSLEYVIALYPLFLSVIMYICIQLHARGCKILVFLWVPCSFSEEVPVEPSKLTHPRFRDILTLVIFKVLIHITQPPTYCLFGHQYWGSMGPQLLVL